jgi:hypothetical protein
MSLVMRLLDALSNLPMQGACQEPLQSTREPPLIPLTPPIPLPPIPLIRLILIQKTKPLPFQFLMVDRSHQTMTQTVMVLKRSEMKRYVTTFSFILLLTNNSKVADMLPSKTIPDIGNWKGHALKPKTRTRTKSLALPARKRARISSDEVEVIKVNTTAINTAISPTSSFQKVHYIS